MQSVRHMICGLRGHEAVLHFERQRLSLRCLSCGHETTGWSLQPETRHGEPLMIDFSQNHRSEIGMIETIIDLFPTRRNRSNHATT
jgi:hypothetical protein